MATLLEISHSTNEKRYLLPTIILSLMAVTVCYYVGTELSTYQPLKTPKEILAIVLLTVWIVVIGGSALLLLAGFILPQTLFLRVTEQSVTWNRRLRPKAISVPREHIADYDIKFSRRTKLILKLDSGKMYSLPILDWASMEELERLDAILSGD